MDDLTVYNLKDVLSLLPLPERDGRPMLDGLSSKWRCVIAPCVEDEEEVFRYLDRGGVPVFLSEQHASAAHQACGPDALAFVKDEKWNKFPAPQIAVRAKWGSPGTTLESSEFHKLIGAFDEVFEHKAAVELPLTEEEKVKEREAKAQEEREDAEEAKRGGEDGTEGARAPDTAAEEVAEVLEMQLFHRDAPASCPQLPPLGNELRWPSFLDESASVICDVDTVISQRGASRWWRLHDGGELVLQAALPLPGVAHLTAASTGGNARMRKALFGGCSEEDRKSAKDGTVLAGKPARLVLFGPKGSYDWFIHEDEGKVRGRITCLDLFNTPDEALPVDATLLPILTVAVLHAGGRPLLIPPNLPCMTLALNDSVTVEQRRISHTLWLDEVSYFLHRTALWISNPLIYEFIDKDLQDESFLVGNLIPALMELFRRHDARNPYEEGIRRRVAASLFAIAKNEKHFKLPEDSRSSLLSHLATDEGMAAALRGDEGSGSAGMYLHEGKPLTLEQSLAIYWDGRSWWPKPGCVMQPPLFSSSRRHYSSEVLATKNIYVPVVYCKFRPLFGTEQSSLEDTVEEYFDVKPLEKRGREAILAYFRTRKQAKDDVLDELF